MKALFTLVFILFAVVAQAQYSLLPVDPDTKKVTYTAVVPVEGVSKEDLFTRAREWSARSFGNNKIAERMNDREAGTLIAEVEMQQPPLSFTDTHANLYKFKVAVYVKEGRYKYQIDDISYQNINPMLNAQDARQRVALEYYATQKETKKSSNTLMDFNQRVTALIADLNQAMTIKKSVTDF